MQELVPIRYGRMLVSPFTFYRGAAYPMAADLAGAPRTGLEVQLCGDAHLSNFGAFAARRPAAGLQHQRLRRDAARARSSGTSSAWSRASPWPAAIAASTPSSDARSIARWCAPTAKGSGSFAAMRNLDLWYSRIDVDEIAALAGAARRSRRQQKRFERNVAKAQSKDSMKAFDEAHDDRRRRAQDRQRPAAHRPDRGRRRPASSWMRSTRSCTT